MDIFFRALLNYLGSTEIMTKICNSSSSSDLKRYMQVFQKYGFSSQKRGNIVLKNKPRKNWKNHQGLFS